MRGTDPIYADVHQGEMTGEHLSLIHHSLEREVARRNGGPTPVLGIRFETVPSPIDGYWRIRVRTR